MPDPVFVRTHHNYESYADLWCLVQLSGFPTCYPEEVQPDSDQTYIVPVLNGEIGDRYAGARARIIHYNMEWDPYPKHAGIEETWHFDAAFAAQHGYRYVPMGSHPALAHGTEGDSRNYDVAYLIYMLPRRQQIRHDLEMRGLWLTPTGAWGDERHTLLKHSRSYLHVHQRDDAPGIPALRMVVAAAYQLPVLMEEVTDRGMFGYSTFLSASYERLPDAVKQWLTSSNATMLDDYRWALYDLLCVEYDFRRSIEAAL